MRLVMKRFALAALVTLTGCNNCGGSKPAPQTEQPAESASGSRPFHTSWDGGRRHLRMKGRDLGSAVPHDLDGGALHPPPPPQ